MGSLDSLYSRLDQLYDIGISLSSEKNLPSLLEKIVQTAKNITHADGGTLYLLSEDRCSLRYEIVRTDSLNLAYGGTANKLTNSIFPDLPLYREDGSNNDSVVAAYAALSSSTINIKDVYDVQDFDFTGPRTFDARMNYRSKSFLTVPMKNHENELIGVLQLINAIDPKTGETTIFSEPDQRLVESLASQAAVALSNRQLIQQLESLFEATIRMINTAIARKSAFTNSHCERVPELTMLIADAACSDQSGSLAGWTMSDIERKELRIAALMHDCGKITTPVHVIDKSTKLETIFDRIELINTRFEIIRRDAQIRMYEEISNGIPAIQAKLNFEKKLSEIATDQALLQKSNEGSERMSGEDIERIKEISKKYAWSDNEGHQHAFLDADEIENLTIVAGTLTAAERQIINDHIVATINMLEELPWPKHLANVPQIAASHHERMDGHGYPKGLSANELSVQARMLAIADIYEALTASDRPYKTPMTSSKALTVLEGFKNRGHIDPVIFDIFVRHNVHQRYAELFLTAEQQL